MVNSIEIIVPGRNTTPVYIYCRTVSSIRRSNLTQSFSNEIIPSRISGNFEIRFADDSLWNVRSLNFYFSTLSARKWTSIKPLYFGTYLACCWICLHNNPFRLSKIWIINLISLPFVFYKHLLVTTHVPLIFWSSLIGCDPQHLIGWDHQQIRKSMYSLHRRRHCYRP